MKFDLDLGAVTLFLCITALIALFAGTPDLMDAIISNLQCSKAPR